MASLFHRSKQRRAEWAPVTAHGNINLVPLVDILTSIVFFSLLTYEGATLAALTSFDLALPPVVVNTPGEGPRGIKSPDLIVAVRVDNDKMLVEHSAEGGFRRQIDGLDAAALDKLQALMTDIQRKYPQNSDVLVIPSDDVNYDNVVHVLERLKLAKYSGISLGTRARGAVAPAGAGR